jgi:hypothetical protein
MIKKLILPSIFILLLITSCKNQVSKSQNESNIFEKLEKVPDSVKVGDITILNLFKNQILAHQSQYDSLRIVQKIYQPHKKLWNNCYGMIFGEENASKFNNPKGMIEWNKKLYPDNKGFFDNRVSELLKINLEKTLKQNLQKFKKLVPYQPKAKISILFTPLQGIGFGGCSTEEFAFELNNKEYDVNYTIEKGIPHELNHLVYEPFHTNDSNKETALAQTIDEGFACYFTWIFFDKKIAKNEAVENMTEKDWNWYLANEKKLYQELEKYFYDKSGNNPLLRNEKFKLFADAPKSLNYWIGFRIIEKYVEKHGKDSWKDIYKLDSQAVFDKSGYADYIKSLK